MCWCKDGAHGVLEPVKGTGLGVLADEATRVVYAAAARERPGLTADGARLSGHAASP